MPVRRTHPFVAHEEEEHEAEARHDDEVDGAPLDEVDREDAEHDDDEVAHESEAAREVELGAGTGGETGGEPVCSATWRTIGQY